ncbi:response regulator transcription factor [Candidatus Entotheonella palauensis]|uniref:response regulator transcription factor n=1 Tax=Candidatus Entotheonella palauensis TaxID=93172 RepID=UPI000B7E04C0|nr:response regulator transcription factor [Candidatus Entotheonella palauensis]
MGDLNTHNLLLVTVKGQDKDIVTVLDAEADDYVTKPLNREVLQARTQIRVRAVELAVPDKV